MTRPCTNRIPCDKAEHAAGQCETGLERALRDEIARLRADLDREHAAMTHYKAEYDAENKRLREALQRVVDMGADLECIFCGLKDKAAIKAGATLSESEER